MSQCCLSGFKWEGKPVGKETKLAGNDTYVTGSNKEVFAHLLRNQWSKVDQIQVAIMIVHDILGWTLPNLRLLADHYAKEADATVYMPDFFDGEVVSVETMDYPEKLKSFDMKAFLDRNSKEKRYPKISGCAKALKQEHGFRKLGVIGFCYGGWAVFRLGTKGQNLVDCISTAHPSLLTKAGIDVISVSVQILAPEHDPVFTPELKAHANSVIPTLNVECDYQHFPGLKHGFSTRGDQSDLKQKQGLERAKNAAVGWFAQILHLH